MTFQTIDVLIPVYNSAKYLKNLLDSILSQTYKNLRIVLVDDGSSDNSASILKTYAKKHNNIEFLSKQNEANISKTRNFLLKQIKSEYFAFIDSDDILEPTYFEELMSNLQIFDADISMCGLKRHKENKVPKEPSPKVYIFNQEDAIAEMLSSNLFNGTTPAKLFKSSLLGSTRFDENIHYGEDLDFCYNLMKKSKRIVFSNKLLYHYIIRKNSIVTSRFKIEKVSCIDCYQKIIDNEINNEKLSLCAKSMQGLIAIEILYYTWRDKYKDKALKKRLKTIIKTSIPYIKKNHRLSKLLKCTPIVWRLTKLIW